MSVHFVFVCLKCGRKVLDFRKTPRCCSERMTVFGQAEKKKIDYYQYIQSAEWREKP